MGNEFIDELMLEYHDVMLFILWFLWAHGGAESIPADIARVKLVFFAILGFGGMVILYMLRPVHLLLRLSLLFLMAIVIHRNWRRIKDE